MNLFVVLYFACGFALLAMAAASGASTNFCVANALIGIAGVALWLISDRCRRC